MSELFGSISTPVRDCIQGTFLFRGFLSGPKIHRAIIEILSTIFTVAFGETFWPERWKTCLSKSDRWNWTKKNTSRNYGVPTLATHPTNQLYVIEISINPFRGAAERSMNNQTPVGNGPKPLNTCHCMCLVGEQTDPNNSLCIYI